jgi:hypothetical protein
MHLLSRLLPITVQILLLLIIILLWLLFLFIVRLAFSLFYRLNLLVLKDFLLNTFKKLLLIAYSKTVQPSIMHLVVALFKHKVSIGIDFTKFLLISHVEWLNDITEVAHLLLNVALRLFLFLPYTGQSPKRIPLELIIELLLILLIFRI